MKKILIIGDAGRGKTTLAYKLSEKTGIPHFSTDDFYWETKFSKPRDRAEAIHQIEKIYQEDAWIIEGTTQWLLKQGFPDADTIIHLDFKNILHQWYTILKRHFTRGDKSLWTTILLLRHVFYKRYSLGYKKNSPTHNDVLKPFVNKVTSISSFRELNKYIDNFTV